MPEPLDEQQVIKIAETALGMQDAERQELDVLRRYVTGQQALPLVVPRDAPAEIREMARIARINLIAIVVNAMVQSLYVDNIRTPDAGAPAEGETEPDDVTAEIWRAWQANRLDRGQSGLYRAVFTYGYGYMVYTAGKPYPVIRPMSPRKLTALYADPWDDWPEFALERRGRGEFRLYDAESVYQLGYDADKKAFGLLAAPAGHGADHCPVVRYTDGMDLDLDDEPEQFAPVGSRQNTTKVVAGQVAPLMTLQDQVDVSSFALKAAEWYAGFRQRWIIGWKPGSATEKVKAAASQMWTFDEDPENMRIGEFAETSLEGFLRSREAVLKYAATLSETPVHELIGELVNLSAEALAAAEAGRDRKMELARTGLGESHEQLAQGVGEMMGIDVPDDVEVVWRDTSARAFGAIVDGLGKLAQMLQIPPQELWDRIPGVTRQDVDRWKKAAASGDAIDRLTGMLDQQANPAPAPGGETRMPNGLILPRGVAA